MAAAASNPGDLVLDPFCGCGTALVAAQKLERRWIGVDITYLAIAVMKARLKDIFGLDTVNVLGQPTESGSVCWLIQLHFSKTLDGRAWAHSSAESWRSSCGSLLIAN